MKNLIKYLYFEEVGVIDPGIQRGISYGDFYAYKSFLHCLFGCKPLARMKCKTLDGFVTHICQVYEEL